MVLRCKNTFLCTFCLQNVYKCIFVQSQSSFESMAVLPQLPKECTRALHDFVAFCYAKWPCQNVYTRKQKTWHFYKKVEAVNFFIYYKLQNRVKIISFKNSWFTPSAVQKCFCKHFVNKMYTKMYFYNASTNFIYKIKKIIS